MKHQVKILLIAILLPAFFGCQSHEKTPDNAFEEAKKEKENERDTIVKIMTDTSHVTLVKNTVQMVEWSQFVSTLRAKVADNDAKIDQLKQSKGNSKFRLERNLAALENDNENLKRKLDEFSSNQKKFQDQMNRDLAQIEEKIRNYTK